MADWKSQLVTTAMTRRPESLSYKVRLTHTERSITVFDKFPKARYHFLLLPRPTSTWPVYRLDSLKTVLQADRAEAKALLTALKEDSEQVVRMIEDEMVCVSRTNGKVGADSLGLASLRT